MENFWGMKTLILSKNIMLDKFEGYYSWSTDFIEINDCLKVNEIMIVYKDYVCIQK